MKAKIIANPSAGGDRLRRRWPQIAAVLRNDQFPYDLVWTQYRGQAIELTRLALAEGSELIVAAGGDGTLSEVVNGFLNHGQMVNPNASVSWIPCGTGIDFTRAIGLSRDSITAARQVVRGSQIRQVDLGEVQFQSQGRLCRRYFINIAGMGFDGEVVERMERRGKPSHQHWSYWLALLTTVFRYRCKTATIQIDEHRTRRILHSIFVCNGKSFGGGMCIAPNAEIDDARFDVLQVKPVHPLVLLWHTPKLFRGTHLKLHQIVLHHTNTVSVQPVERMLIQADGDLLGEGPAIFRIHPAKIRFRV